MTLALNFSAKSPVICNRASFRCSSSRWTIRVENVMRASCSLCDYDFRLGATSVAALMEINQTATLYVAQPAPIGRTEQHHERDSRDRGGAGAEAMQHT